MKYIVGVDVGGTKIAVVLADENGRIIEKKVLQTQKGKLARQSVHELIIAAQELLSKRTTEGQTLAGIGFGVPGAINSYDGVITKSPNLPGWEGIKIKQLLEKTFNNAPVFLDNDANVACVAEKVFGFGAKYHTFLYVTVSTGVGAGIIANNVLVQGANGYGGEIGHMVLHPDGRPCKCGKRGCVEAYVGGAAMATIAREHLDALSAAQLKRHALVRAAGGDVEKVNAAAIAAAAAAGDKLSKKIFSEMGCNLGIALSSVMQCINPQAIILGGSVVNAFPFFEDEMQDAIKKYAWPPVGRACKILRTKLGDSVADIGAVALVMNSMHPAAVNG